MIVSPSLFNSSTNERGKKLKKTFLQNLSYLNSSFTDLCLIFEDRYNKYVYDNFNFRTTSLSSFIQSMKSCIKQICKNISVKICFCMKTDEIFKNILEFIQYTFNKSPLVK